MGIDIEMPAKARTHRPHTFVSDRQKKANIDLHRGSSSQRGYDATWRKVRLLHLAAEPLCRFCANKGIIKRAQAVDHILTISTSPELRLDDSNLRSLCKPCHDRHTATQQGFAKRKESRTYETLR